MRRSRPSSFIVPVWPLYVQLLPANPNRELYSIQNMDAVTSVFVSPLPNVAAAPGDFMGQEIVARGYVSDDMDQGEVYATTTVAARVVVQETITEAITKPPREEQVAHASDKRQPYRAGARTPFKRDSRIM